MNRHAATPEAIVRDEGHHSLRRATGAMSINPGIVLATLKRDGSILDLVEPSTAGRRKFARP
ncbi:hypothetical protein [Burkholderia metallica]|uniref:hypothetical protein n=1 Tax=Burkholderia metallica TaxID=488729 RepID=UPI0012F51DCD|nr:hypothetical protein [Burkholderia metallica]MCA7999233.1 hypothetical protein [Burkholderia metallica]